ncbi:diaminopropionate ammonia-lyase [Parasalinivibrio latis]|uniref:diaminopropionate ammonia-lyase n=1 Tax=Parasalinivibrio latis TaxID=2952610 RepID=UPI0030DF4A9C
MVLVSGRITHFLNPKANADAEYSDEQKKVLDLEQAKEAIDSISAWPEYNETPLHQLSCLANEIGVSKIWYKDEAKRFGLKSFKALGGAYAVGKQLQLVASKRYGEIPDFASLLAGQWKEKLSDVTVTCATDGNHGRSVAWGAQMFGCRCVIYIHKDVSEGRKAAMEAFGAEVIRIDGNYDESVRIADENARVHQRIIVSDTSYEGYMEIPKHVAAGYTVMLSEITKQLGDDIPTHVFVQGGVGGLASAVCGYFWLQWGNLRPRFIVVEPEAANCLQKSAVAGKPVAVEGDLTTLMAGLECGEVSMLAWKILSNGANDFLTISEDTVPQTMRLLAKSFGSDPIIEAGESAVAGLAALLVAADDNELAKQLRIGKDSKILVLGTEGATDPIVYQELIAE